MILAHICIGLCGVILGLVASLLTPYHRTLVRRLKSIHEVSEDALNGFVGSEDAILFVACESDLTITCSSAHSKLVSKSKFVS